MVAKNEAANLRRSLPLILQQRTARSLEVIVIDSGSTDGSPDVVGTLAQRDPRVRLVQIPPDAFHHAKTRNFGVSLARGPFVAFLGGDAIPDGPTWLDALVEPVVNGAQSRVAASYGRQVPKPDATPSNVCRMRFVYGDYSFIKDRDTPLTAKDRYFFSTVNCCISRELAGEPLFDEAFPVNEDWTLAKRLISTGLRIAYCADARVIHSHNYTFRQILQRSFDNGVVGARLGIFQTQDRSIRTEAWKYLRQGLASLGGQGVGAKAHFLGFYLATGVGIQLGLRYKRLPKALRSALSKYQTA